MAQLSTYLISFAAAILFQIEFVHAQQAEQDTDIVIPAPTTEPSRNVDRDNSLQADEDDDIIFPKPPVDTGEKDDNSETTDTYYPKSKQAPLDKDVTFPEAPSHGSSGADASETPAK